MALVKGGYGGYGYGKPQLNYPRQNTESMTTVVTEINRMSVNEKPCYGGGGGVQKQVYKKEVIKESDQGYNGYHGGGGGAVQKQVYEGSDCGGYSPHNGGAAVEKHSSYKEEVYGEAGAGFAGHHGGTVQKHGYEHEAYGEAGAGYAASHGGAAAVQQHAYQKGAYGGHADAAGYAANHGGAAMQQHAYQQGAYGHADGGYGAHYGGYQQQGGYGEGYGGAVKNGYRHKAGGYYGGAAIDSTVKHGYQMEGNGGGNAGYGGAHYGGAAHNAYNQQAAYGYKQDAYGGNAYGHGGSGVIGGAYRYDAHGSVAKTEFAGGHNLKAYGSDSEGECDESDVDSESDCEEAYPPRGPLQAHGGGAHRYEAYKREEKHGGGVRRYETYERREELGGGRGFESYQITTQEGFAGGAGAGYGACAPRKNRFFF